ncbi:NACHT, LRR and PYD domains-containing protein 13 [Coemansia sp. BCRC 34301]|nr:NACHT, LRR and PYD domains-containing protein 13 [Coemansia sp. BCRC 34301]
MNIHCTIKSAPVGITPTTARPKSRSIASISSLSTDNNLTLCEQARDGDATDDGAAAQSHSREICFLDLTPSELDVSEALGGRSAATIECLRINRCRMDGKAFARLVDDFCSHDLPCLHTVDVSQNQLSGIESGAALAKLLRQARAVRFLSLGWNKLSLADLRPIASGAAATAPWTYHVEYLDLRANPLSAPYKTSSKRRQAVEVDEQWVGSLVAYMPRLTHVQLAQAAISDKSLLSLLGPLTRTSPYIQYIGLEWLGLGNRLSALRSIVADLAPPSKALHLNLSANHLGDSGVEVIAMSGAVLNSLTLACNFITERGTGMLAKWLPMSGLRALDLSDNYFGDQGVVSLLAARTSDVAASTSANLPGHHCTQLVELGLTSCCLSDTSVRLISEALMCNWAPLELLRIIRNSRMSPGAKHLL